MNPSPSTTVSFTGHRTYDGRCDYALRRCIRSLYAEGFRTFLSGMAVGFDLAAARAVVGLRGECPGLRLVCVVPFAGQARRFAAEDRRLYEELLAAADATVVLQADYTRDVYARRNDYLVDAASAVVAWYDGSKGGTRYTVRRARGARLRIVNLWQDPQLSFSELTENNL